MCYAFGRHRTLVAPALKLLLFTWDYPVWEVKAHENSNNLSLSALFFAFKGAV